MNLRLYAYVALGIALALIGWRVMAWRSAYQQLQTVQDELQAELDCEAASHCAVRTYQDAERAQQAVASARQQAEAEYAQEAKRQADENKQAIEQANQRLAKQSQETAQWRARYEHDLATNKDCAAWAVEKIACTH